MSALGSMVGVLIVDLLMRKAGESGLKRFVNPKHSTLLKARIEHNAGWTVFLATLIPPPFPFTAVVMTAVALQVDRRKLLGTVFLGRMVRFSSEALLAIYFGKALLRYISSDLVEYLVYAFIVVGGLGTAFSLVKWWRD